MGWVSLALFGLAGVIHLAFFFYESFYLQTTQAQKALNLSDVEHKTLKPWAFNQGFYNLCLSIGTFLGLYFVFKKQVMLSGVVTGLCGFTMIIAGLAFWWSVPRLKYWALVQILPPALGFIFLYFHIAGFF